MNHYLIIHGAWGSPEGNWFPWLKTKLADYGHVSVPIFPTPEGQNLASWLTVAERTIRQCPPEDTFIIGHSSGAVLSLRLAERATKPFRAVFSVCPFSKDLGLEFDEVNKTFVSPPFDWLATRRGATNIKLYAGSNDPYVPLAYSQEIADALHVPLTIINEGGHLNADVNMFEFETLADDILELS